MCVQYLHINYCLSFLFIFPPFITCSGVTLQDLRFFYGQSIHLHGEHLQGEMLCQCTEPLFSGSIHTSDCLINISEELSVKGQQLPEFHSCSRHQRLTEAKTLLSLHHPSGSELIVRPQCCPQALFAWQRITSASGPTPPADTNNCVLNNPCRDVINQYCELFPSIPYELILIPSTPLGCIGSGKEQNSQIPGQNTGKGAGEKKN